MMDNEQKASAAGPMSIPYKVCCLRYSPLDMLNDVYSCAETCSTDREITKAVRTK